MASLSKGVPVARNTGRTGGVASVLGRRLCRELRCSRSPGRGGRWTTDVWAPLEGRVLDVDVRWRF